MGIDLGFEESDLVTYDDLNKCAEVIEAYGSFNDTLAKAGSDKAINLGYTTGGTFVDYVVEEESNNTKEIATIEDLLSVDTKEVADNSRVDTEEGVASVEETIPETPLNPMQSL